MSLLTVLRAAVKIADKVTKPLQCQVDFYRSTPDTSGYGGHTYPTSPTARPRAIVDWKQKQLRTAEGVLTVCRASVNFLDVAEVYAMTSGNGINDDDRIVLPDGTTGPIIDMGGFIDAGTGQPLATEVFLG